MQGISQKYGLFSSFLFVWATPIWKLRFMRLCSEPYKKMIRKEKIMTLNDFNRIYYVLVTLDMMDYAIYFAMKLFPELLVQAADQITLESQKKRYIELFAI